MTHSFNQGELIGFCALGVVVMFLLGTAVAAIGRRINRKKEETFEPHAGKTLGL